MLNKIIFVIAALGCYLPAIAQDFYVSQAGSDQNNGLFFQVGQPEPNGPFQTLARAQLAIRDLKKAGQFKEPVTVHIQAGNYQLARALEFDVRDSGFAGREVNWQGEGGQIIIGGGLALQNCSQDDGKIWSCPTAGLALDTIKYLQDLRKKGSIPGFEMFVNEQPMHLARWPNSDWAHIKVPLDERTRFSSFEALPPLSADLTHAQVHIWPGSDWVDVYLPVSAIDQSQNQITLASNTPDPLGSGRRYYLQNIRSELDAPGEWFYDQTNNKILFIPPENTQPKEIVVSALQNLMVINGANHISFSHLTFQYSTGVAINIDKAQDVQLDGIEASNIGTRAIEAKNSSNITIANSHIHDTGEGGILITGGDRNTLQPANNLVHNNHIHDFGRVIMTYTPAIEVKGVGSRITHNLIEHSPGEGVEIVGNDHIFEKNEIRYVCEQASDCGAIYTGRNWTYRGNIIRYNSIHDIYGYGLKSVDVAQNIVKYGPGGARGVYLDDAVSSFDVSGNIFNRAGEVAIQLGGGRDNRIENNLINTDSYAIWVDNRWPAYNWEENKKTLTQVPYKSPIWQAKYPELALPINHETWPEGNVIRYNVIISGKPDGLALRYFVPEQNNALANNLVWSVNGQIRVDYEVLDRLKNRGGAPWQEWINEGVEHGSINADPCATITGNVVRFCNNSPIKKIGFQALPADIGLIK